MSRVRNAASFPWFSTSDGGESSAFSLTIQEPRWSTLIWGGCTNPYGNLFHDQPAGVVAGDACSPDLHPRRPMRRPAAEHGRQTLRLRRVPRQALHRAA